MSKFKVEAVAQKNIPLLFAEKVKLCSETFLQAEKDKSGKFQYYSYKDVYEKAVNGEEKDLEDILKYLADDMNVYTYIVPAFSLTKGQKRVFEVNGLK